MRLCDRLYQIAKNQTYLQETIFQWILLDNNAIQVHTSVSYGAIL